MNVAELEQRRQELVIELAAKSEELAQAQETIEQLRSAIRLHREQTGHNLCWLNDVKLWEVLADGQTDYPHDSLPPEEEFAIGCRAYYQSRRKETKR